jgi:hypothetical protein
MDARGGVILVVRIFPGIDYGVRLSSALRRRRDIAEAVERDIFGQLRYVRQLRQAYSRWLGRSK